MDPTPQPAEKYQEANARLAELVFQFKKIVQQEGVIFVDLYTNMEDLLLPHSVDGVHLGTVAYRR